MRDRRGEQRNRRVPTKAPRQREVGEPERENLDVDRRRVAKQFHRRDARAHGRRERMFGAGHDVPQGAGDDVETRGVRQSDKISRDPQGRRVEPQGPRGEQAPQAMNAPGGTGLRHLARRSEMFDVAQRAFVLAMARQRGADGRGAQGQTLPQRPGERRMTVCRGARTIGAAMQDRVEKREPGAGEKNPIGAGGGCPRRLRPSWKSSFQQGVRRRETRRGEPARPPPQRNDGRLAARIGGGRFVVKDAGGIESDHGVSITRGGALSPCFTRKCR